MAPVPDRQDAYLPSKEIFPMLTSLRLQNFRCFEGLSLDIGPGLNLFLGGNGQGNTTILEGACLLMRLQSQRSGSLAPVLPLGTQPLRARGTSPPHAPPSRSPALRP